MILKKCSKCQISKPRIKRYFNRHSNTTDGWKHECRECCSDYRRINRTQLTAQGRLYRQRIKEETIKAYGGVCSCCGEDMVQFLTIEHLNGRDYSNKGKGGHYEYLRLKSLGYPTDGITVLCYDCNCTKGVYGTCPHTWHDGIIPNKLDHRP